MTRLFIVLLGMTAMASLVWIILTDPLLAEVCWPSDIHAHVVAVMGGATTTSVSGQVESRVGWLSVFLRLTGVTAVVAFGISAIRTRTFRQAAWASLLKVFANSFETLTALACPFTAAALWLVIWFLFPWIPSTRFQEFFVATTPLWTAVIFAGSLGLALGLLDRDSREFGATAETGIFRWEFVIILCAAAVWEATSFWMNERLYAGLLVPHGDSAMYEEHLWNVWHGKGFRSYLDQGLFVGEHIQVIHLLLLPLHMLWPSYLTLELVASGCLAICVMPIFSIALRHSGSPRAAMWLSLAWLLFFPMHFLDIAIDLKTLRPSCYGLPFLFWGIDFAERRQLRGASICLFLAMLTQEDFALIVGPIGGVLYLTASTVSTSDGKHQRRFARWCLAVALFSVVWLFLAVLVVIPSFRGGAVVHYSRYFGDLGSSPGDLLQTALQHPVKILSVVLSFRTFSTALLLTAPLGLLTFRRPKFLLAGVLTFLMLSLIQLGNDSGVSNPDAARQTVSSLPPVPYHHFHAPLLPVLLWAAAAGLKPTAAAGTDRRAQTVFAILRSQWNQLFGSARARGRFAFFCSLGAAVWGSIMPCGVSFWSEESGYGWSNLYVPGPRAIEFPKVLALLPEDSRVAATDYVHTRLTHFERSYDYSDYLRAVNNYQPGVPNDTDFIVIDTSHPYSRIRTLAEVRELQAEPEKWEVLSDATDGLFIVLQRRDAEPNEQDKGR